MACAGSHAVGTVFQAAVLASGRGPVAWCCRSWASATTATWPTRARWRSGTSTRRSREPRPTSRRAAWGPAPRWSCSTSRRHRHRLAGRRRAPRGRAAAVQLRRPRLPPRPRPRVRPAGAQARVARIYVAVCATDAPLSAQQLRRLALRPLLGLARIGSYASEARARSPSRSARPPGWTCRRTGSTPCSRPPTRRRTVVTTTAGRGPAGA